MPILVANGLIACANSTMASATLDNSGTMRLMPVAVNSTSSPGTRVKDFIETAGARLTVSGAGTSKGIAVTAVDNSNGTWQYALNGTTWQNFGTPSSSAACLLTADSDTRVRFVPNNNFSGVVSISFKAWDNTGSSEGSSADTMSGSAYSSTVGNASLFVGSSFNPASVPSVETRFNVASGNVNLAHVFQLANGNIVSLWRMSTDAQGTFRMTIRKPDLTLISETATASVTFPGFNPGLAPVPLLGGGFAVVFADSSSSPGNNLDPDGSMGVRCRIYDDNGNLASSPAIVVNTVTSKQQFAAAAYPLANGGFLACFIDQSGANQQGRVRRFDANGNALDPVEISVSSLGTDAPGLSNGSVQTPRAALLADGSMAVAYNVNTINQMYLLRMDPDGNWLDKVGGTAGQKQFLVSGDLSTGSFTPFVTALSSGGFFVFYQDQNGGTTARTATYRMFDKDFNASPSVDLETVGNISPYPGAAPLVGGGFVLARVTGSPVNNTLYGVFENSFSGPAVPSGMTAVATTQTASFLTGGIVPMNDGGFLFRWFSGPITTSRDLYVKVFPDHTQTSATVASMNRANASPAKQGTVNWTVTFSSAVSGVSAANFSLSGTAASGASIGTPTGSGTTWNVPVAVGAANGTLELDMTSASGLTPNVSNLSFSGQTYTIDTTAPTVSISAPSTNITAGGSVSYTVTYSDANFASSTLGLSDITLNSTGTATGDVSVSGTGNIRTITISNISGDGTLGISLAAGTATDLAGNPAPAAGPSTTFTVDNTAPAISVSAPSSNITAAGPVTFTVTCSDANFAGSTLSAGDITLISSGTANGTVDVTGSGTTHTVTIANITGDGTLGISVAAGTASDLAGNIAPVISTGAKVIVDNTAPTISIGAPSTQYTYSNAVSFEVTCLDANISGNPLVPSDIILNTVGTATGTVSVTGTGSMRTVTVSSSGSGTISISIAAGAAIDPAGNPSKAAGPSQKFVVVTPATLNIKNHHDGTFGIGIDGVPGVTYTMQSCTNLVTPVWTPLGTADTDNLGLGTFTATNRESAEYFRAVLP